MAAANFRISTAEMADRVQKNSPFWTTVGSVLHGQLLPSHGGMPITVNSDLTGKYVGASCGDVK